MDANVKFPEWECTGKRWKIEKKEFFLTYPQCDLALQIMLDHFRNSYMRLEKWIICHELHKDGTPHRHAYLKFPTPMKFYNVREFDIRGFHPNIMKVRLREWVVPYCAKQEDYITNFTPKEIEEFRKLKDEGYKAIIGKRILDGENLTDLVRDNPKLVFGYKKLRQDVSSFEQDCKDETLRGHADIPPQIPNTWGLIIPYNPSLKKRHLWIYSKSINKGKTTNRKSWCEKFRLIFNPYSEGRWNHIPKDIEGICFDPYGGKSTTIPWDILEEITDGRGARINVKGGDIEHLEADLTIFIFSNHSIEEVYPYKKDVVYGRFIEICLD